MYSWTLSSTIIYDYCVSSTDFTITMSLPSLINGKARVKQQVFLCHGGRQAAPAAQGA